MFVCLTRHVLFGIYHGLVGSTCFLNCLIHSHSFTITILGYWQVQNLCLAMMSPSDKTVTHPAACKTVHCKLNNVQNWNRQYPSGHIYPLKLIFIGDMTQTCSQYQVLISPPTWSQVFSTSMAALGYTLTFLHPDGTGVSPWSSTLNHTSF